MEPSLPHSRPPAQEIESWDDEDFVLDNDDSFHYTPSISSSVGPSRRDSLTSHRSRRSDLESVHEEEESGDTARRLLISEDEKAKISAIAAAANLGIPIPNSIPASALLGGSIKRLGARKIQQVSHEDWGADLELPDTNKGLALKHRDPQDSNTSPTHPFPSFPGTPRRSSLSSNLSDTPFSPPSVSRVSTSSSTSSSFHLDQFREEPDDGNHVDFLGNPLQSTTTSPHHNHHNHHNHLYRPPLFPQQLPMQNQQQPKANLPVPLHPQSLVTPPTPQQQLQQQQQHSSQIQSSDQFDPITYQTQPQTQQPRSRSTSNLPSPADDDFENDFELPADGRLRISQHREAPKTPLMPPDDIDWVEGSLGTRYGGTSRVDIRSTRSSSISAHSPSVCSSMTTESEDDLEGLILPSGQLNLEERLKLRIREEEFSSTEPFPPMPALGIFGPSSTPPPPNQHQSPMPHLSHTLHPLPFDQEADNVDTDSDDLFSGLELGDGSVFDSRKLTLHKNVKIKENKPTSPNRPKITASITFTNKNLAGSSNTTSSSSSSTSSSIPQPTISRLPRLSHDRNQSLLAPVSESGDPVQPFAPRIRRPTSRTGNHNSNMVPPSSYGSSSTLTSATASSFRRRELATTKTTSSNLRHDSISSATSSINSAQNLRIKRSLPTIRSNNPNAPLNHSTTSSSASSFSSSLGGPIMPGARVDRPTSRSESRTGNRPKTPIERGRPSLGAVSTSSFGSSSSYDQTHRGPPVMPIMPSNGASAKTRTLRRPESENSFQNLRPPSRPNSSSRPSLRSPSPRRAQAPTRSIHDGMGLTTATTSGSGGGTWRQFNKPVRSRNFGDGHELDGFDDLPTSEQWEHRFMKTPLLSGPKVQMRNRLAHSMSPADQTPTSAHSSFSASRVDSVPHFARETAASRIAREASLAHRASSTGVNTASSANIGAGVSIPLTSQRVAQLAGSRIHGPAGGASTPSAPSSRASFSISSVGSSSTGGRRPMSRKNTMPQKPHLISNLNQPKSSRVVNGMVYNPLTYRWEGNENALYEFDGQQHSYPPQQQYPNQYSQKMYPHVMPSHQPPLPPSNYQQQLQHPLHTQPSSASFRSHQRNPSSTQLSTPPLTLKALHQHQTSVRDRETPPSRPALITNINGSGSKGVQVVGGMVFDPQNMCWLKVGPSHGDSGRSESAASGFGSDEEDVFKDIPDLEDSPVKAEEGAGGEGNGSGHLSSGGGNGNGTSSAAGVNEVKDDWLVGEEFDVGPEFVRRQREEEAIWQQKCSLWFTDRPDKSNQQNKNNSWKWSLRRLVQQG